MLDTAWARHANHKNFVTLNAGRNLLVPSITGQRIIVNELQFVNTGLQDVYLMNGDEIMEPAFMGFPAGAGFTRQYSDEPAWILDISSGLYLFTSVGTAVRGFVKYRFIASWEGRIQ